MLADVQRAEAVRITEHLRCVESEALARMLAEGGLDPARRPSQGVAVILSAIGRIISIEKSVGISLGHTEAIAIMDRLLGSLEPGHRGRARTARGATVRTRPTQRVRRKQPR